MEGEVVHIRKRPTARVQDDKLCQSVPGTWHDALTFMPGHPSKYSPLPSARRAVMECVSAGVGRATNYVHRRRRK